MLAGNIMDRFLIILAAILLLGTTSCGCADSTIADFVLLEFKEKNTRIFLKDETALVAVKFVGPSISYRQLNSYTYHVLGTGEIQWAGNVILVSKSEITVNTQKVNTSMLNHVLEKSGNLIQGAFIRDYD